MWVISTIPFFLGLVPNVSFVSVHITAVVIPFLEIPVTLHEKHTSFCSLFWPLNRLQDRPEEDLMGLLETLLHHYYYFVPPNAANDHQRLRQKQSGDSELWKVLENCSRVSATTTAFFNDFFRTHETEEMEQYNLFLLPSRSGLLSSRVL